MTLLVFIRVAAAAAAGAAAAAAAAMGGSVSYANNKGNTPATSH